MKNCETCGIEVNVALTPFADEVTGFVGEYGVTCLKCDKERTEAEYEYDDAGDYEDDCEDNAQTAEREYHDRKMELYDMWKKEY